MENQKKIKFEEKVKQMTAGQIIMAMVTGARKEHVKRCIGSFGHVKDGICYGCVAANTICEVMGLENQEDIKKLLPENNYGYSGGFSESGIGDNCFVCYFEWAIDILREGNITGCNYWLNKIGLPDIKNLNDLKLPRLGQQYTEKDLKVYEKLAKDQEA